MKKFKEFVGSLNEGIKVDGVDFTIDGCMKGSLSDNGTVKENLSYIVNDLEVESGTATFTCSKFELKGKTKSGKELYLFQTGDLGNEFGGIGETKITKTIATLDDKDILPEIQKAVEKYTGEKQQPMLWRADMFDGIIK